MVLIKNCQRLSRLQKFDNNENDCKNTKINGKTICRFNNDEENKSCTVNTDLDENSFCEGATDCASVKVGGVSVCKAK